MPHLVFLCLAARRIGPADVKVKAAKVRTFLGLVNLVNFTARFIPDLATVFAPLRQLTKNGESFVWGAGSTAIILRVKETTV